VLRIERQPLRRQVDLPRTVRSAVGTREAGSGSAGKAVDNLNQAHSIRMGSQNNRQPSRAGTRETNFNALNPRQISVRPSMANLLDIVRGVSGRERARMAPLVTASVVVCDIAKRRSCPVLRSQGRVDIGITQPDHDADCCLGRCCRAAQTVRL